jgi:chemotaxis protein MotB
MTKKRGHDESHIDETWLIPYADLLTLLLALFIVLFASSSLDAKKFETLAQSLSNAFNGGTGVLQNPSPTPTPVPRSTDDSPSDPSSSITPKPSKEEERQAAKQQQEQQETEDLQKLKQSMDKYIHDNGLDNQIETKLLPEGLKIVIRDLAFFRLGSAEIKPEARNLAVAMSHLLAAYPRKVVVSGHTDNVPITSGQYSSNWDLSTRRAVNFLHILLENDKLDPSNFSAVGYGEYQPVVPNDTEEHRAQNRRIEVFIQRKTF